MQWQRHCTYYIDSHLIQLTFAIRYRQCYWLAGPTEQLSDVETEASLRCLKEVFEPAGGLKPLWRLIIALCGPSTVA